MSGRFLSVIVLASALLLATWWISEWTRPELRPDTADTGSGQTARIVSLSPAMTDVLFAIGAGDRVVGVSDYCLYPPEATELPRAGTILTPNYETLARLEPTLIVGDQAGQVPIDELAAIAFTRLLPWLSVEDVAAGVQALGRWSEHAAAADSLAARMVDVLDTQPPAGAPRVLFALAHRTGQLTEVWFIKDESLHGAVLRAAGGQNAVTEPISGPPRLALERVVGIDPEMIVVLSADGDMGEPDRDALLDDWRALEGLAAVRNDALSVVAGARYLDTGPVVLELVPRLRAEIEQLSAEAK